MLVDVHAGDGNSVRRRPTQRGAGGGMRRPACAGQSRRLLEVCEPVQADRARTREGSDAIDRAARRSLGARSGRTGRPRLVYASKLLTAP